jgi:histidine triad (HIT) family protein
LVTVEPQCVFCHIVRGSSPAQTVYEDEDTKAFLDIAPASEGHTLVVPRIHARTLLDISTESASALMRSAAHVARIIDRTFHPDGMTMVQTNERAGGQSVFHVHLHLVPRWNGDGLITPWRGQPTPSEALASTRLRIIDNLEE